MGMKDRRKMSNDPIKLGDEYINTHALDKGIRIADEQTINTIRLSKKVCFGTCYYKKVVPSFDF